MTALGPVQASGLAVESLLDHWRSLAERVGNGEDVAAEEASCFLGRSRGARRRHADRFYSLAHCRRMAALDPAAAAAQLGELLQHVVHYAGHPDLARYPDDQEKFLRNVLGSEYVACINRAAGEDLWVPHAHPGGGYYEDLYEWLAGGMSIGGRLRLFKSTGEPFTPLERRSAMAGIRMDILWQAKAEDPDTDWRVGFVDDPSPEVVECDVWFEDDG